MSRCALHRAKPAKRIDARRFGHKFVEIIPMQRQPASNYAAPTDPAITVHVPTPLRDCCAGASELALPATSLRAVLATLERRHPKLHRSICDETGALRRHINLFVNTQHMRDRDGLDTALKPGDVVTIMTAVSGG